MKKILLITISILTWPYMIIGILYAKPIETTDDIATYRMLFSVDKAKCPNFYDAEHKKKFELRKSQAEEIVYILDKEGITSKKFLELMDSFTKTSSELSLYNDIQRLVRHIEEWDKFIKQHRNLGVFHGEYSYDKDDNYIKQLKYMRDMATQLEKLLKSSGINIFRNKNLHAKYRKVCKELNRLYRKLCLNYDFINIKSFNKLEHS